MPAGSLWRSTRRSTTAAAAAFRFDDQSPSATGVSNVSVCSIWRKDGPGLADRPIIDLYFLDYRPQINQKYDDLSDVQRIFLLFLAIVGSVKRFIARPLHLYPVDPRSGRDWRLLRLRVLLIVGLIVFLGLWQVIPFYEAWHTGRAAALASWWKSPAIALALASLVGLAALVFVPPKPLEWNPWFRFVGAAAVVAAVGSYLMWRYGLNLYDFLGTHAAVHAFGAIDLVQVALLLSALIMCVFSRQSSVLIAASLEFGAANQPVSVRQHFQILLGTLALFNLVVYLAILILAFVHTAKQQIQYWASGNPVQAVQGETGQNPRPAVPNAASKPAAPSDAGAKKAEPIPAEPTTLVGAETIESKQDDHLPSPHSLPNPAKKGVSGGSTTKEAATGGVAATPSPTGTEKPAPAPAPTTSLPTVPQQIVIVVTAVLFLMRPSWKAGVTAMGNTYLYFYYYLGYGRVRPEVVGQFRLLLEKVAELDRG